MSNCGFCGWESEDGIGMFYHRAECLQEDILKRIDNARQQGERDTGKVIRELERKLELARYVGD